MKTMRKDWRAEAGSVMVEYVVVLSLLGVSVYTFFMTEFYSPNGYDGVLGQAILGMMQRILEGIAMPIP